MNNALFSLILAMCCATISVAGQADDARARQIMRQVEDRDDGDRRVSDMQMVLVDKNGDERVRVIRSYIRDVGDDTQRLLIFDAPADVAGTGFLTYDYDDAARDDDQWLYLPALRKTKRIASTDRSGSFMGSDFNYSDMTSRDLDDYDFTLQKEISLGDHRLWVIEAMPRSEAVKEETGYSKALLLVRQDNYVLVRGVYWTHEGGRQKYFDMTGLEQIGGIWTPTEMTMTAKQGSRILHRTVLRFSNVRYNQDLDESLFTVRSLERER